jgi:terpene synthase-like protein
MPISLPGLPFPTGVNQHVDLLDQHLDTVAARYGNSAATERSRWAALCFGRLAALMYPDAPQALLTLSGEALVWIFEYDDYLLGLPDEDEERTAWRLKGLTARVLSGEATSRPATPLGLLWDICGRARMAADLAWWLRFRHDVQDFADLMYDEACSRAERRPPAPEDYQRLRRGTSGWALLTDLAELAAGRPLPPEVTSAEHYRRLRWAAGDIACAINDLLSYPKELAAGEYHNLVMVLAHSRQVSVAEAQDAVTATIAAALADYELARADFLLRFPREAGYVRALEHLTRGSLDWSLESGRYPAYVEGRSRG